MSHKRISSKLLNGMVLLALLLSTLPAAPAFSQSPAAAPALSQAPAAAPAPPQAPPPPGGALRLAPPAAPPAAAPADATPSVGRVKDDDVEPIGPAKAASPAAPQSPDTCSAPAKIPFGQDLEITMGPMQNNLSYRLDQNPAWGADVKVTYIGPITNGLSSCPSSPLPEQVLIYKDADYGSTCRILIPGQYPHSGNLGIGNDELTSMKVGSNVQVMLCKDADYGSTCATLGPGSYPHSGDLGGVGNDSVSSAKVWLAPHAYGTSGVAAIPLGTDAVQVAMKTDSASGELAVQPWSADTGWGGMVRLGLSTDANPVMVGRTFVDYAIFARSGTKIKVRQVNNNVLDPAWTDLPGVTDAASDPAVVATGPYHIVLFYRTSDGTVKFTEWESGIEWRTTPVSLGKPSGTSMASDLSAVSRDENHIAVFGVSANNKLWVKEWSNANQSDWSDTSWVSLMDSVKTVKPAVASRYTTQIGVVVVSSTAQALYYKEWTHSSGWTAPVSLNGWVEPPSLSVTSGEEMFVSGVNSSGNFYTKKWTPSGWGAWSAADAGWTASQAVAAVVGRPHDLMVIGRDSTNRVWSKHYTNQGQALAQTTLANPSYGVLRSQAVATVNARTAWVSVYRASTGAWTLEARDTTTWSGVVTPLTHPSADTDRGKVSVAAGDLDQDGNDEIVVGTINSANNNVTIGVYKLTLSGSSVTGVSLAASKSINYSSQIGDIQIALGDLDGNGVRAEVGLSTLWLGYAQAHIMAYKYTGSSLSGLAAQNAGIGTSPIQDLEMAIGQVDSHAGAQIVLAAYGGSSPNYTPAIATYRLDPATSTFSQIYTAGGLPGPGAAGTYATALATGDIDSDGLDEVVYTYGPYIYAVHLPTPSSVIAGPLVGVSFTDANRSLAVGDVDMDGRAEIVYSTDSGLGASGGWMGILKKMNPMYSTQLTWVGTRPVRGVPLLADLDGDSYVATFKSCNQFSDVHVIAVANSQPVWYQNGQSLQTSAGGIANSSTATTGSEDGWTASFGGALTVGFKQDIEIPIIAQKIGEVRSSVTQEFGGSTGGSTEQEDTTTSANGTAYGGNGFSNGVVVYTKTSYKCYQYQVAKPGSTITTTAMSCVVVPVTGTATQKWKLLEDWYLPSFKNEAGESWVAVGHHPPNTTTLSVDLGWANNYTVRTSPPVDPYRVWWSDPSQALDVSESSNPQNGSGTWSVEKSSSTTKVKSGSFEENTTVSAGFDLFSFTTDASFTAGYGKDWSSSVGWGTGLEFNGAGYNYPNTCPATLCKPYSIIPYIYQAQAKTNAGVRYPYLEQDYYLSSFGLANQAAAATAPQSIVGLAPQAPVITSTTHPNPNTWYPTSTVVLSWSQPAGDPAVVTGYKWNLDQSPVVTPTALGQLTTTHTYQGLADGIYYLHIQAVGDGGDLSPITNRAVRVDMDAPQAQFVSSPLLPNGFNGWYNTPITVTVMATDTHGSGVASAEYSADGTTWQPYITPIQITANTSAATLWARVTDHVGHTSAPISTTLKLDKTRPRTVDSDGYGLSYASIITDEVGNAQLVLGGALSDTLSGRLQVEVKAGDTGAWHTVSAVGDLPVPPGNQFSTTMTSLQWIYTPTFDVRGVYPLWARGVDAAGNYEAAWVHGVFWWQPDDVPVLDESRVSVAPHQAYPGDVAAFTVGARNSGYQEAQLLITDTVPAGVTVLPDSISDGGQYNAGTRVITWTLDALWPGQTRYLFFNATANSVTTPVTLENRLDMVAYWPWGNYVGVPPEPARHYYSTTTTLTVLPSASGLASVASSVNSTVPRILDAAVVEGEIVNNPQVTLLVNAGPNTRFLYVKEWTWDGTLNQWSLARESGWVPFVAAADFTVSEDTAGKYGRYQWTLSEGDGVKYLGLWVADADGQISNLNEGNLIYTNLVSAGGQQLTAGQRVQYRVRMHADALAVLSLVSLSGDADLYVWKPRAGFKPNYYSNAAPSGEGLSLDAVAFFAPEEGMYVIEVQAATDAYYRLTTAGDISGAGLLAETQVNPALARLTDSDLAALKAQDEAMRDARRTLPQSTHLSLAEKDRPAHPLDLSTPYGRGDVDMLPTAPETPIVYEVYLPLICR